jgi:bile acid:Na+ symporter, BASS family
LISLISIISTFALRFLLDFILKKLKFNNETRKSLILFGTVKNSSFASAVAISLFSERASLPGAIFSVFLVIYLIFVSFLSKKD